MEMEEHAKLIRKRGTLKTKITIFNRHLTGILDANAADLNKKLDDDVVFDIEERLERAKGIIGQFDEVQESIDMLSEDPDESLEYRETFEKDYYAVLTLARKLLSRGRSAAPAASQNETFQNTARGEDNQADPSFMRSNIGVKLPIIEVPKFNGNLGDWLEFRDTFGSMINDHPSITNIQKFHYLKAALGDSAGKSIKSWEFSAANYEVAWKALCERFDNNKLLLHNHIKSMFDIKGMQRESAYEIRNLLDNLTKHIRALDALQDKTNQRCALVIFIMSAKLDPITSRAWEKEKVNIENPCLQDFIDFLASRSELLQTIEFTSRSEGKSSVSGTRSNEFSNNRKSNTKSFLTTSAGKCTFCQGDHYIQNCPKFVGLNPQERAEQVKNRKMCLNCLKPGHFVSECKQRSCLKCQGRHNTLLHFEKAEHPSSHKSVALCASRKTGIPNVLLSTALVTTKSLKHGCRTIRVILDSCSQTSFITEEICNSLKLNKQPTNFTVAGINQSLSDANYRCEIEIESQRTNFNCRISCLVVPEITDPMPNGSIDTDGFQIPSNIKLADPTFHIPGKVDMLIGGDWFWSLLCVGQIKLNEVGLVVQKTRLGWIVGGPLDLPEPRFVQCNIARISNLELCLQQFWSLEEVDHLKSVSVEEKAFDDHFLQTVQRNADGRFVVNIPLKRDPAILGDSRHLAERRLLNLEKRFKKFPSLKNDYVAFLEEYERLGHMSKVENESDVENSYYLAHHCVVKEESTTTKVRVVFDGSAKASNGLSINDIQIVGSQLQDDLFDILLRFRKHRYILSADAEKMYRQVLVDPEQRQLQRILWRSNPEEPIQVYELNTVTYGTKAASFLAIRVFVQLALEVEDELPEIAKIIRRDFYVDDLLTGADSKEHAKYIVKHSSQVLARGCFKLRKWTSNEPSILRDVGATGDISDNVIFSGKDKTKTLGLIWRPSLDILAYEVRVNDNTRVTKRQILAEIAQIFDPLGLLGPTIVKAKIFMQTLWSERVSWDESLPVELFSWWIEYKKELPLLNNLKIARHVFCLSSVRIELHGFADASKLAYGACVYVKSHSESGEVKVALLCSKSKVAPLKTQTIPRLELCAALLISKLIRKAKVALDISIDSITYWSDSTIVLSWLKTQPCVLPVFVSNRVAKIQEYADDGEWRHVPTKLNPADCLSRGLQPKALLSESMWWKGPEFLKRSEVEWPEIPANIFIAETNLESIVNLHIRLPSESEFDHIMNRFSDLNKIVNCVAYVKRFIHNIKHRLERITGPISLDEKEKALTCVVKAAQARSFSNEIKALSSGATHLRGRLSTVNAFIDEHTVLRVGGRLSNSGYSFDKKYPILLASDHVLTKLIIESEHRKLMHAGPQLLLATIRERFWPLGGRSLVKKIVKQCVTCAKANPKIAKFIMGNLPKSRVSPTPPFATTGVDYAGPFLIQNKSGRGCRLVKCWISLFVCFSTKALHIEIVSDLTKESFISALRRFVSRRGKPNQIHSDNGTSFVGANNELMELGEFLTREHVSLGMSIENLGIDWHFIPAYSPHFGGIWEAGVKSVKYHLRRVASNARLTYEQFYTLLVQIEAILNSRPLTPLSSDPNDLSPLTPAHFLIGRTFNAVADPTLMHLKEARLSNWQRVQQLQQHWWTRWSKEYVSELQLRSKWRQPYPEIRENTMVLIKEDNVPPAKWRLGRVIANHPGTDNIVRVISVRTATGTIRRTIAKICPLPTEESNA